MAASLAAPLHADWAALYFWVAARVLARWDKVSEEEGFWRMIEAATSQRTLRRNQEDGLRCLVCDIRRSVERHARLAHTASRTTPPTQEGTQK